MAGTIPSWTAAAVSSSSVRVLLLLPLLRLGLQLLEAVAGFALAVGLDHELGDRATRVLRRRDRLARQSDKLQTLQRGELQLVTGPRKIFEAGQTEIEEAGAPALNGARVYAYCATDRLCTSVDLAGEDDAGAARLPLAAGDRPHPPRQLDTDIVV
jgi:hypothetical protein